MSQYYIEVRLDDCTSCGVCYLMDPLHFESNIDGKAHIVNGKIVDGISRGNFNDTKIERAHDTELACPSSVIKVVS